MSYQTPYSDPALSSPPDVYRALVEAVQKWAVPAIPSKQVIRAWQNRVTLPKDSNEFCIVSVLNRARVGTNVREYTLPESGQDVGRITEKTLREVTAQLDFFSDGEEAELRADSVQTVIRGFTGASHFREYGIGSVYCEDVRIADTQDASKQQIRHAVVTVHLFYWGGVSADVPFFDSVDVKGLWPDITYTPKEGD